MPVLPIACLKDNYAYLLWCPGESRAVVVDPSASDPVIASLEERGLELATVLLSHHHWDHTGGVRDLVKRYGASVHLHQADQAALDLAVAVSVRDGEIVKTPVGAVEVCHLPGHTLGSVGYLWQGELFTGDTLFCGGCGRIFEGTAEQMYDSLSRLAQLEPQSRLYPGHEYTLHNLGFASEVEPDNTDIARRIEVTRILRQQGLPSVPSTIGLEQRTNPFLRCRSAVEFAQLRSRKDAYRL